MEWMYTSDGCRAIKLPAGCSNAHHPCRAAHNIIKTADLATIVFPCCVDWHRCGVPSGILLFRPVEFLESQIQEEHTVANHNMASGSKESTIKSK